MLKAANQCINVNYESHYMTCSNKVSNISEVVTFYWVPSGCHCMGLGLNSAGLWQISIHLPQGVFFHT